MKYRVTLTIESRTHPRNWIYDTMYDALYSNEEELIDVGIVELEDDNG